MFSWWPLPSLWLLCCFEERNGPVLIQAMCEGRFYIEEPHPWNGAAPSFKGSRAAQNVLQKCAPRGVLSLGLPLTGCLSQDPPGARNSAFPSWLPHTFSRDPLVPVPEDWPLKRNRVGDNVLLPLCRLRLPSFSAGHLMVCLCAQQHHQAFPPPWLPLWAMAQCIQGHWLEPGAANAPPEVFIRHRDLGCPVGGVP